MADTRTCEQCETVFTPPREHSRFCSASCRIAWNKQHTTYPGTEASALDWSITAMRDAVEQLGTREPGQPHGLELTSDTVWRITLVDATLIRYHAQAYEAALSAQHPAERLAVAGTLTGLRYVRNRMGYHDDPAQFIQPEDACLGSGRRIADWRWITQPEPALAALTQRGQEWEMSRYRAYQAHLAGHTVGQTFSRAGAFLNLAAADLAAASPADLAPPVPSQSARTSRREGQRSS